MNKSLGDYNIEKSSSHNIRNIVWTMRKQTDTVKSKNKKMDPNKKFQNSSFTNIIYDHNPKVQPHRKKIFKIKKVANIVKSKNKKMDPNKKFQNSSALHCNIEQSFKRPGR